MNRKTTLALVAYFVMLTTHLAAQVVTAPTGRTCAPPNKFEIDFNVNRYQNDFGFGLHIRSPYFFIKSVAVKAGTNIQWLEHLTGTETTWTQYQNFQLGFRGRSVLVSDNIAVYGEGGMMGILPNSDFSSLQSVFGGYGLFGFEFKPIRTFGYFIEMGGVGTGATADKVIGKPIYSTGFVTKVGLRVGFY